MADIQTVKNAKNEYKRLLFMFPNVVGVGVGYKVKNGYKTNDLCIIVNVAKKLDKTKLLASELIPKTIQYKGNDICTDVVESGEIKIHTLSAKVRPLIPGYSIGNVKITAGTLGCIVTDGSKEYILSNNHVLACFPEDVMVMTVDGYKKFKEVTLNDDIATTNKEGYLEYQKPTNIINESYDGGMIHFKQEGFDFICTPNHKLYIKQDYISDGHSCGEHVPLVGERWCNDKWYLKEASDVKIEGCCSYRFTKAVKWCGSNNYEFSDDFIRLVGWLVTDGCICRNKISGQYSVNIRQLNEKNKQEIAGIFSGLGYKPYICKGSVVVNSKELFLLLDRWVGRRENKHIPKEMKSLPKDKLKILLDAIIKGDGCIAKHGEVMLCTKSWILANDYMEIITKLEKSFHLIVKKGSPFNKNGIYYLINSIEKSLTPYLWDQPAVVKYSGRVGCVTVPNGIINILSNNKPVWVGNCSNQANIGSNIVAPGSADGGNEHDNVVGQLADFVEIKFLVSNCPAAKVVMKAFNFLSKFFGRSTQLISINTASNVVDCALSTIMCDYTKEIYNIGKPDGIAEGILGMKVRKSGRTTEYTEGEITQIDVSCNVNYGIGNAEFSDQLMVTGIDGEFSAGGDSGSAVLSDNKVVGLLFAGGDNYTVINRIQNVFDALKVELA